jgi:exosortase K
VAGLVIAWALKSFYSHAGAEDLSWLLSPTCRLAGLVSGIDFEREPGTGWISHTHRMIVGSSCSGMNFLIVSFLTIFCSSVHRARSHAARCLWLGASLGIAWTLTITTNAARILLAIHLYSMDIYGGLLTPARAHRAAGTVVYCLSLLLGYITVDWMFGRFGNPEGARRAPSVLVPLGWYLGVAVGLPLVNRAWQQDTGRFLEHSALVVSVCLLVAVAALGARMATLAGGARGRTP